MRIGCSLAALLALLAGCSTGGESDPRLQISTDSFADAHLGFAYSADPLAKNGSPPYMWSVPSGSLPAGLSLDAATGRISGTPTVLGTSSFTLRVLDSGSAFFDKQLSLTVVPAPLLITTKRLPYAVHNQAYNFTLSCTGSSGPVSWTMVGSAPPNVVLGASDGVLSGPVTSAAAPSSFGVTVTDGTFSDHQVLAIEVDPAPVTVVKVRQAGGPGYFTSIALALASATAGPISQTTIIEIDDDAVYSENVNIAFTFATGNEWLCLRPSFDRNPTVQALNPAGNAIRVQSSNVELRGLKITGATSAAGVKIDDTVSSAIVVNCVVSACGTGIESGAATLVTLVQNTIHCDKGINASGLGSCIVHGNIVFATGAWAFRSTGCSADYNLLWAPSGDIGTDGVSTYSTLLAWKTATGNEINGKSADPLFASAGTGDYRLQAGSPAVDYSFKNAYTPFTDADMHARNSGADYDMGAYEREQ